MQRLAQQEREKKLAKLVKFRKDVKRRVHQVQKTREQKTCAETTANSPRGEALSHTSSHVHVMSTQNPDDEAVLVEKAIGTSIAQRARKALLALVRTDQAAGRTMDDESAGRHVLAENELEEQRSEGNPRRCERNTVTFHQSTEEPRLADNSLCSSQHPSPQRQPKAPAESLGDSTSVTTAQLQRDPAAEPKGLPADKEGGGHERCIVVSQGKLEHSRKVQAQREHLTLKRLWSRLEREQARQAQHQRREDQYAARLKGWKEAERREQESNDTHTAGSESPNTEQMEDRERAEQWAELMALEERRHKLTKAKENERFIEALREKVKQRMILKHSQLPALCSCARTFWETDPDTCANNCIFYKNEKAYAKALWSLMVSLELQ